MRLTLFLRLSLLGTVMALTGCSSQPEPPPSLEYAFWLDSDAVLQNQFRITFFKPDSSWYKSSKRRTNPLLDDHNLFLHLEKELDQRQLCLQGYQIMERRPTAKGITLAGRCSAIH
ncbi:hypothetical protein [uncultured Ferrimonas sp.]|uniref:hypothetical protein n=1 Tax=uncultured Ferrimonas sp. TaxID=432640 RepID=UPI00261AAB28|nr:hypothetical protein [uncultured Ferrimonas sp.]